MFQFHVLALTTFDFKTLYFGGQTAGKRGFKSSNVAELFDKAAYNPTYVDFATVATYHSSNSVHCRLHGTVLTFNNPVYKVFKLIFRSHFGFAALFFNMCPVPEDNAATPVNRITFDIYVWTVRETVKVLSYTCVPHFRIYISVHAALLVWCRTGPPTIFSSTRMCKWSTLYQNTHQPGFRFQRPKAPSPSR